MQLRVKRQRRKASSVFPSLPVLCLSVGLGFASTLPGWAQIATSHDAQGMTPVNGALVNMPLLSPVPPLSPEFSGWYRAAVQPSAARGPFRSMASTEAVGLPDAPSYLSFSSPGSLSSSAESALDEAVPQASQQGKSGQAASNATDSPVGEPSKRVLFIIPNYRSVRVGAKLPPQSVREKFVTAARDSIDPAAFVLAGLVAGESYIRNSTPEFGKGGVAFGRYYWHSYADQTNENLWVEFIVPALTQEDTRYYTLGSGSFKRRAEYSLSRVVITRSDKGRETANLGELVGAGVAAGLSSLYYKERSAGSVLGTYGLNLGIDAASYMVREFDSDLSKVFSRK